jgi:hypothetical protein
MSRIVHFEVHASEPDRAIRFYQTLLGWQFHEWDGPMEYWMIRTGDRPGIDGGLNRRRGPEPAQGQPVNCFTCTVNCTNLDARFAAHPGVGGRIAVPKMVIPGVGWLACFKVTEGNIPGAMQDDPSAR